MRKFIGLSSLVLGLSLMSGCASNDARGKMYHQRQRECRQSNSYCMPCQMPGCHEKDCSGCKDYECGPKHHQRQRGLREHGRHYGSDQKNHGRRYDNPKENGPSQAS